MRLLLRNPACVEMLLIAALAAAVIFPHLGEGSLADYDEALYGEISRETLESGDWVTLHLGFQPFFQGKPPLFLHLVSATYRLFGVSTLASRLWPAVFGVGTVLSTCLLARELFGRRVAFTAGLVLATAPQFLHYSRMLMLDVPATFFITLSLWMYARSWRDRSYLPLFGVCLGLGAMTKGVGVMPLFIVAAHRLLAGDVKPMLSGEYLGVYVPFLIIAAPWHLIQLHLHGAGFISEYFGYNVLSRFAVGIEGHGYGNVYYLRVLSHGLGFWFYALAASVPYLLAVNRKRRDASLILSWIGVVSAVVLAAGTKLPWYLIPLYPAFAVAIAFTLSRLEYRGLPLGVAAGVAIFLLSFNIPGPLHCNDALMNMDAIAGGGLRVHDSVPVGPGELFYLGVERYGGDELLEAGGPYVAAGGEYYTNFSKYKVVYAGGGYVLFSREKVAVDESRLSKPPAGQNNPLRYCYAYMPMNLGVYYKAYSLL